MIYQDHSCRQTKSIQVGGGEGDCRPITSKLRALLNTHTHDHFVTIFTHIILLQAYVVIVLSSILLSPCSYLAHSTCSIYHLHSLLSLSTCSYLIEASFSIQTLSFRVNISRCSLMLPLRAIAAREGKGMNCRKKANKTYNSFSIWSY